MNKGTVGTVAILAVILIGGFLAFDYFGKGKQAGQPDYKDVPPTSYTDAASTTEAATPITEHFSGIIEYIENGCTTDTVCYATVDGKRVSWDPGNVVCVGPSECSRTYRDNVIGRLEVGKKADVFAEKLPAGYATDYIVYSRADFYIRVQ